MADMHKLSCRDWLTTDCCFAVIGHHGIPQSIMWLHVWCRGAGCYNYITPVLQELHWLPVRHQVDFKMATLVYLSLSGMAPAYLAPTVSWSLSSAAFCHIKDVRCETNLQQLWSQVFCSCRSEAVEQPSSSTSTS